jgi:hypothetical protein
MFVISILIALALVATACQPADEEAASGGAGQGEMVQRIKLALISIFAGVSQQHYWVMQKLLSLFP